jgi:hypothetical protein
LQIKYSSQPYKPRLKRNARLDAGRFVLDVRQTCRIIHR